MGRRVAARDARHHRHRGAVPALESRRRYRGRSAGPRRPSLRPHARGAARSRAAGATGPHPPRGDCHPGPVRSGLDRPRRRDPARAGAAGVPSRRNRHLPRARCPQRRARRLARRAAGPTRLPGSARRLVRPHRIRRMTPRFVPAALVVLAACGSGGSDDAAGSAAPARVPVALGMIARDSLAETLTLTGRLEPRPGGGALLAAPAAGVVRAVRAQVGDRVARGAVVVELEVPELAADAAQKAAVAAQAEREAARQEQLLADGITSARQAEEAAANAGQTAAAAAAAHDLLARTRVASPVAGRVQEVMVQPGERVDAGNALAQVVAADTLDLAAPVPAPELGRLRTGLAVDVVQDGDTAVEHGWLAALAPGVDTLTNAGEAVIRVPNGAGRLHSGAAATARIRLGVRHDVLV